MDHLCKIRILQYFEYSCRFINFIVVNMDEKTAATKIQKVWRSYNIRRNINYLARNDFLKICEEFNDQTPVWKSSNLSMPQFNLPNDYMILQTQAAIASRLSHLKYQDLISQSPK